MENGNAFKAFLAETAVTLNKLDIATYYPAPLPVETDDILRHICGRFQQATPQERQLFLHTLTQQQKNYFGIFGHRAATLALRQNDPSWLKDGLVGNLISNAVVPPRRSESYSMAIFHHVAQKLGLSPAVLFAETAVFAPDEQAQRMIAFGKRSDIILSRFGWKEIKTPDGIKFKFDWK
jgi:hypothetical protein